MYYCGIDIAKRKHEVSVIDEAGHLLSKSFPIDNSADGAAVLFGFFSENGMDKSDVLIGMEATGHYWLSLYSYLTESGCDVKVINPITSDAFRKMYIRQTKNDSKDSFVIAQIMRFGEFNTTELSEENVIALRQLSRYRLCLVESVGDCKRRIIALLDQVFPEYASLFSDTFGVTSLEILTKYQSPEDLAKVPTKRLAAFLSKASKGRFKDEKARELKAVAKGSFGVAFAKDAFAFQIKQLVDQLVFLEGQIADLESEVNVLMKSIGSPITTITGIGPVLGAAILGEIGDIKRFDHPSKLVAFAGLDVKVVQSGEFTGTQGKMSKRGSPYLRRAIWLAANVAAFSDPTMSEYYQSLRKRGKHHLVAVSGVARKMCNVIFVILSENKVYDPHHPRPENHPGSTRT
ncbi:MAG: IS110 family transposase [Clostridiales Family XIII bacterium]|jgi:transposase|nr:IS110 family transposase [Clostridiales Family XIII bacterium]